MGFKLNEKEYFSNCGVDVLVFSDFYPEGHQSGVTLVMNDKRLLANGDVRFEQTPGQWQPIPKRLDRVVDTENNAISATLTYPDKPRHLHGFNPMIYPDFEFTYKVTTTGTDKGVKVTVDLDREIPEEFSGKLCFNMELFPGEMFDRPWIMDDQTGIFPRQPNGPTLCQKANIEHSGKMKPVENARAVMDKLAETKYGFNPIIADDIIASPYAVGSSLTIRPDDPLSRFTIVSKGQPLKLYDGRMNHNNGWFVVNCEIPMGKTTNAIELEIIPNVEENWVRPTVIQVSQVGYHPNQPKRAIAELDKSVKDEVVLELQKITPSGYVTVKKEKAPEWGEFLRYRYCSLDFSEVTEAGLYRVICGDRTSTVFRIDETVYDRGVWQPVLEYFLPVQMCHMRVNEKYKVWHGRCHCDDGRMAPTDFEQFDGAAQGPSTMTTYKPGEHIPGVNKGGWHDAGDFDLRIESQTGEMYYLANTLEEFNTFIDSTTIDQEKQIAEIHQPDGKNDILQQIEHGALSVIGGYKALGRLYHEIMCSNLRQYVLLGDPVNMTEGNPDNDSERFVFTEDNPDKELGCASHLAAAGRALRGYNDELAEDCIKAAIELYDSCEGKGGGLVFNGYDNEAKVSTRTEMMRVQASCELLISTGEEKYRKNILDRENVIFENINEIGWIVCKALKAIGSPELESKLRKACVEYKGYIEELGKETPYQVPYRPAVWGAGWGILRGACAYYYVYKAFPDILDKNFLFDSLNFVLGVHPGSNTKSFVSGVGTDSAIIGYGLNRADWSYIPGGVASGTALIRPDLPELLDFPYLWQQMEYVIGGSNCYFLFLVQAILHILGR